MKTRLNLALLALILSGTAVLTRPVPASATWYDPWGDYGGGGGGVEYCCVTPGSSSCCYRTTGCMTKPGMCAPTY